MTNAARAIVLALAALVIATPSAAHELGPTRVHLTLDGRRGFEIALVGDPELLLQRLEAIAGSLGADRRARPDERLDAVSPSLLGNLNIRFDNVAAPLVLVSGFQPAPEESERGGGASSAIVLRGTVSPGARHVSWQCGFLYGSYPIVVSGDQRVVAWVQGTAATEPIRLNESPAAWAAVRSYVVLGITHIVPGGLDHVLFILGIFVLSMRLRDVVAQVSAFTLAHSMTLGLSLAGVVSMPGAIVEPLIALSIAYVAVENLVVKGVGAHRLGIVVAFGMLHGLGFAGVLSGIGVPADRFFPALFGFNAGVEIGQLFVAGVAMALARQWRGDPVLYRRFVAVPVSCALAVTGICWTVLRLAA